MGVALSSVQYICSETDGTITLTVNRVGTNNVTYVDYATSDGSAIAGINYSNTTGRLVFNPGEILETFRIGLIRDTNVTGALSFNVSLSNAHASNSVNPNMPVQIYANNPATVTINDADPGLTFTNSNFGVFKSSNSVVLTVLRSNANTGTVSVNWATTTNNPDLTNPFTAVDGVDFLATNNVLTFSNGVTLQSFSVPIINNGQVRGDRTFGVKLLNPTAGAQILPPSMATVTITDDVSGLRFASSAYSVNEGQGAVISVQRTGYTNSTVTVSYTTRDGTAVLNTDYYTNTGTLTFTNGQTTTNFTVQTIHNTSITGDSTVLLSLLTNITGNAILVSPSAATLTILEIDGNLIEPAGAALISESYQPANGVIDTNETVTMLLALRNKNITTATNVVATLLSAGGVANPSGPASYGNLVGHGPSVSRPFSFRAALTNGQTLTATLQLTYDVTNQSTASFSFMVGQVVASYTNSGAIVLNPYPTNASPYPSAISVNGVGNAVSKAVVTVTNFNAQIPGDVSLLLVSPSGSNTFLMSKCGGASAVGRLNLTFDDASGATLPQSTVLVSGTNHPTCYATVLPPFQSPVPGFAPYLTNLSIFNGANPNGSWALYALDDHAGSSGVISNGWILNLTTAGLVGSAADLAMGMTVSPPPYVVTSNVTFTLSITNFGPSAAAGVVVTNPLPANTAYVSYTTSSGWATNVAGQVIWYVTTNSNTLTNGAVVSLALVVQPSQIGTITNSATVSAATADPNPDDNSAALAIDIVDFSADLQLSLAAAPDPVLLGGNITYLITVSNAGPATATAVTVSDTLPAALRFVSASGGGSASGQAVSFSLGDLGSSQQRSVSLVAKPVVAGLVTNMALCLSPIFDPLFANNFAQAKSLVEAMQASRSGADLIIAWPSDLGSFVLESATNLNPPIFWTPVTNPQPVNGTNAVTIPVGASGSKFFRLHGQGQ
jgi:uncharacterized repeat protein (TIGR01451 family)